MYVHGTCTCLKVAYMYFTYLFDIVKYLANRERDDASIIHSTHHGVSFAARGLTIGKDGTYNKCIGKHTTN